VTTNATQRTAEPDEESESDSDQEELYDEEEMYRQRKEDQKTARDQATEILIDKRLRKWLIQHGKGHLLDF
jgi:hypothetical protein